LRVAGLTCELTLQSIDATAQSAEVYAALLASLKLADRRQQLREGCFPFPRHEKSLPN
jgi:hypothetical protein